MDLANTGWGHFDDASVPLRKHGSIVIRQLAMTLLKIELIFIDIRLNVIDSLQLIRIIEAQCGPESPARW
jgi:hypothetical protein